MTQRNCEIINISSLKLLYLKLLHYTEIEDKHHLWTPACHHTKFHALSSRANGVSTCHAQPFTASIIMRVCPYLCPQMADSVEERRKEEGEVTTFFLKTLSLYAAAGHTFIPTVSTVPGPEVQLQLQKEDRASQSQSSMAATFLYLLLLHFPPPPSISSVFSANSPDP